MHYRYFLHSFLSSPKLSLLPHSFLPSIFLTSIRIPSFPSYSFLTSFLFLPFSNPSSLTCYCLHSFTTLSFSNLFWLFQFLTPSIPHWVKTMVGLVFRPTTSAAGPWPPRTSSPRYTQSSPGSTRTRPTSRDNVIESYKQRAERQRGASYPSVAFSWILESETLKKCQWKMCSDRPKLYKIDSYVIDNYIHIFPHSSWPVVASVICWLQ